MSRQSLKRDTKNSSKSSSSVSNSSTGSQSKRFRDIESASQNDTKKQIIKDLKTKIGGLRTRLEKAKEEYDKAMEDYDKAMEDYAKAEEKYDKAKEDYAKAKEELATDKAENYERYIATTFRIMNNCSEFVEECQKEIKKLKNHIAKAENKLAELQSEETSQYSSSHTDTFFRWKQTVKAPSKWSLNENNLLNIPVCSFRTPCGGSKSWKVPITIGSQAFSTFQSTLNSPPQNWLEFKQEIAIENLIQSMSDFYPCESDRTAQLVNCWNEIFPQATLYRDRSPFTDKANNYAVDCQNDRIMFEVKNKLYGNSSDPFTQIIGCFVQGLDITRAETRERMLICVVGAQLWTFGACVSPDNSTIVVEPISSPIWFCEGSRHQVRTLFSAIDAFLKLDFSVFNYPLHATDACEPRNGNQWTWHATKPVAFSDDRVLKFSDRYGKDVHEHFHTNGWAPKLLECTPIPQCGLTRVQMTNLTQHYIGLDDPSCYESIDTETFSSAVDELQKFLQNHDYVHGDLRAPNIMVKRKESSLTGKYLQVIDFDWSGNTNEVYFPRGVASVVTDDPPGTPITKEHDQSLLKRLENEVISHLTSRIADLSI